MKYTYCNNFQTCLTCIRNKEYRCVYRYKLMCVKHCLLSTLFTHMTCEVLSIQCLTHIMHFIHSCPYPFVPSGPFVHDFCSDIHTCVTEVVCKKKFFNLMFSYRYKIENRCIMAMATFV